MKGLKTIVIAAILAALLSGCNRNAADMIVDGGIIINEEAETMTFSARLTDEALEPDTPFQVRFFIQGKEMREALGTDLIFVDEEMKSRKASEQPEEHKAEKRVEIKKTDRLDELVSAIKNKDKEAVTVEIVNDNGRIDDKVLHKVKKE
ncbi:hypothetical protein [Bacillus sp. KH172YL63]|uniref:hypothetical protein n=1 Tax=Bacillus sp. KH172YL63 TaxID=2709784 RepID=UPI0013E4CE3F|nr:hypothetical protein [Bacillus sp. KH172YL63]BCB04335.1 hypothetical protein KH172YL63_24680 [Bacillus sp. KH172YL63]